MNRNFIKFFLSNLLIASFAFNPIIDFVMPAKVAEAAEVPSIISYQGRLADSSGNLLGGAGTTYYFKFSIWNNSTVDSGTKLWPISDPSSFASTVRQGVFTVNIGDTASGFPHALNYDFATAGDVYLQVEASSNNSTFQTLSPRQRIGATPFARLSAAVSGSTTPSSFGTTTPFGTSIVSIEATSSNSVPVSVRAKTGQSANLFQIQNSTGSNLFFINSLGGLFASSSNITYASSTALTLSGDFFGNNILQSADSYINFGTTQGTDGYGFRDNSGTLQVKNSSGSWSNIPTSGTTQWTTAGSNIYYNTGNVGIGTTSPNWKLSVAGIGSFDDYVRASYLTATSTTATSTFAWGVQANALNVTSQIATSTFANGIALSKGCFNERHLMSLMGGGQGTFSVEIVIDEIGHGPIF